MEDSSTHNYFLKHAADDTVWFHASGGSIDYSSATLPPGGNTSFVCFMVHGTGRAPGRGCCRRLVALGLKGGAPSRRGKTTLSCPECYARPLFASVQGPIRCHWSSRQRRATLNLTLKSASLWNPDGRLA